MKLNTTIIFGLIASTVLLLSDIVIHKASIGLIHNSEKNIHIIAPAGVLNDTKNAKNIANNVLSELNDGKFKVNGATIDLCGKQTHVFSIGINKYKNNMNALNYAVSDAKKVPFAIQSSCANSSIQILLDDAANRENIMTNLKKLFDNVKNGDTVVVYYSGHGIDLGDSKAILPFDTSPNDKKRAITLDTIVNIFKVKTLKAKLFIFVDAGFYREPQDR